MRKFQLIFICCIYFANSYGQTAANTYGKIEVAIIKESRKTICTKVNIISAFPGGDSSWVQDVETKLNQSAQFGKGASRGKYLVSVQFITDKEGNISDVRPLTRNGYGMEAEVMRAILKKPKWLPASQPVPVKPYRTSSSTPPLSN